MSVPLDAANRLLLKLGGQLGHSYSKPGGWNGHWLDDHGHGPICGHPNCVAPWWMHCVICHQLPANAGDVGAVYTAAENSMFNVWWKKPNNGQGYVVCKACFGCHWDEH